MELALEILLPPFVACLILTGIHVYLGLHVVSRGVIFVDLALAQIAALGATFALLLGYDPHGPQGYVYSLLFAFVGAAVFSMSRLKDQRIPQEAIIGISFAVASAATILIADRAPQGSEFVEAMLTGALLWVSWATILKTALIYGAIGLLHWIYRERFLTVTLHPETAVARGWNVRWWDFLFYMSFGFVITGSVAIAGILLVFSFLVIPTVIAMFCVEGTRERLMIGWAVGTIVSSVGLLMSYQYDFPSGPAVVCTFGAALVVAATARYVLLSPRRGSALMRVAAAVAAAVVALGLAVSTSRGWTTDTASGAASPTEVQGAAENMGPADDTVSIAGALRALDGVSPGDSSDPEREAAIATLIEQGEALHRLMAIGEADVSEAAVAAIAQARDDESSGVGDLLAEIAYHALDPWARLRASIGMVERAEVLGIPALIELLEEDFPPLLRMQAADALRAATGEEISLDPLAALEEQAEAVVAWEAWWVENRAQFSLDR